jgi:outer membrane lipoprotein SlyB
MRYALLVLVAVPLTGCVVADLKTGRLYKPSSYASERQCDGGTHSRRVLQLNGINDDYMMADCAGVPVYDYPARMQGR